MPELPFINLMRAPLNYSPDSTKEEFNSRQVSPLPNYLADNGESFHNESVHSSRFENSLNIGDDY